MNTPKIKDGSTLIQMLKSLGFIEITDVDIIHIDEVTRKAGSLAQKYRGCWGMYENYTAIVDNIGHVYLHYGEQDFIRGQVFSEVIDAFGCNKINGEIIVRSCTPQSGEHFDSEQLLMIICGERILT